jgi:N-acetylneuraminic acid mutarotase
LKRIRSIIVLFLILSFSLSTIAVHCVLGAEDAWTTKEPMLTARTGIGVAVVNGKIYAIGGANQEGFRATTEEYDPATNTWTFKTPMLTARSAFGIAVYQNKIYCIGGYADGFSATGVNEVYDPATNTWETKSPMLTPRMNIQANVVNGKIYLIGGNPNGTVNEVYDPATDTWFTKASISTAVSSYASAVVDNKIYVISSNLNHIYHVENDSWSYGAPPPSPTVLASAGATTGVFAPERIYVFGADADLPYWQLTLRNFTTQSYDPKTNNWKACVSMPTGRFDAGVAVVNDMLFVIGGFTTEYRTDIFTLNPSITYSAVNEQYIPIGYIPEFPSWIILPLFFVATIVGVAIKRKSFRPT